MISSNDDKRANQFSSGLSSKIQVVIAEDEADIANLYTQLLSEAGLSVARTFENGKELAEFVARNVDQEYEPDLVITDLRMPVMDGVEAARTIRSFKPKIKIILTTAHEIPEDAKNLFDGFLNKPFTTKELIETVLCCLDIDSGSYNQLYSK